MPQNWWEAFPEVVPSPAARPRPLPGPGGVIPGPAMGGQPYIPSGVRGPAEGPTGAFDPSFFSGGALADDQFSGGGFDQTPVPADGSGLAADRDLAIRQAGAAIQRGAHPDAVRARLNQMGLDDSGPEPSGPFADLVPGGPSRKGDDAQLPYQAKGGIQPPDPGGEIGRAIVDDVNQFATDPKRSSDPRVRLRLANEMALNVPTTLALLDTVASAEGANYNTMFGNRTFNDMRTHPGHVGGRFQGSTQSAAGRYQIQADNYHQRVERMGPLNMLPPTQDLMAADIIRMHGGLDALKANDFASAVSNLSGQWASLPHRVNGVWQGSRFPHQTAIPIEVLTAFYNQALRYYATPGPIPPRKRPPLWVNLRSVGHRAGH